MKEKKEKKPKVELTPEQKKARCKKRAKIAGIVIGVIVLILGILIGIFAIVNVTGVKALMEMANKFPNVDYIVDGVDTQLKPVIDEQDGYWTFTTDNDYDFKVLQFTDVHIGAGFGSQKKDSWAMNAVATMITAEKPDLVIVTGDIAYPVPFQAGTFNNLNATKIFATLMESLGVYWTFSFGNHDTEAYSTHEREDICKWYDEQNFEYCLFQTNPKGFNIDGYGNQIIKVKNKLGIVTRALTVIDSHSYTDGDSLGIMWKYDNIHQNQVDWYETEMKRLTAENAAVIAALTDGNTPTPEQQAVLDTYDGNVKSLAFFHIALREFRDAWAEYRQNGSRNTANVEVIYGNVHEDEAKKNSSGEQTWGVWCGVKSDKFFDTGAKVGLQGVFIGHDHYNNFSLAYKKQVEGACDEYLADGIRLTYGMSIDYLAYPGIYKEGAQRGCTVINVNADGTMDCSAENYYQEKYSNTFYPKEDVKQQW